MKASIISMLAGATFIASVEATAQLKEDVIEQCLVFNEYAGYTMLDRQNNEPMSEVLEAAADDEYRQRIVVAAYEYAVLQPAEHKQIIAVAFSNHIYRDCLKAFGYPQGINNVFLD